MRCALATLALAAGCGSKVNPEYCAKHFTDHQYCAWLDGGIDSIDAPALCLGSNSFALCVDPPTAPAMLPADVDTDLSPLCLPVQPPTWKAAGQPDACVIVGTTIAVPMSVAHGGRPLVLVASDTITVTNLDVSSKRGASAVGAGYAPGACAAFASAPGASTSGAGGGAGGTLFGSPGGDGAASGVTPGGGAATAVAMPTLLQGGCPGQDGGAGTMVGGTAGAGGGAVYLAAGVGIDLTSATINASGASATGGGKTGGGGGGGGGYIQSNHTLATTNVSPTAMIK